MKHLICIFLFLCTGAFSQSFKKVWEPLQKRIDKGESFSNTELNIFLVKYEKDLDQNLIERSILFDFLGGNAFKEEKYEQAVEYFNKAIEITKIINDTVYRAFYNYDLACLYNHIGYYPDAESLFRSSLPILAVVYGQNSLQYTMRFKVLAEMYVEMGNYAYAKSMNDALLYYFKTLNGEKDREYLICLNNDARISQGTGNYAKAVGTFKQLLLIHEALNPLDTVDYITTMNNTAEAYRLTGNYNDALGLLKKAMALYLSGSKRDELILATMFNNIGLCYKATGNYNEAEKSYDQSIAIYKKLKLDYSPDYTNSLNNQAELYRNLGRFKQAHDLLLNVIYIRKNSLGTQHQNYANALNNMALVYIDEGSYKEAEPFLLEANEIYKELLGENHAFYANGLNSLAMLYVHLKRYKESEVLKMQALTIIKNSLGDEHERYAYFLGGTVTLYDLLGKYDQAIENVETSNKIIKNKFGEKHIAYIDGIFNLAYFQWKKKNYKKAEDLFTEALRSYKEQFDKYFETMSEAEQLSYYEVLGNRFDSFDSFVISYTELFPKENHNELLATCFNYQLFIKSLLLNKSVNTRKNILSSNDTSLVNKYNRWISIKHQLAGTFRDLDFQGSYWNMAELEEEANRLEQYLKNKSSLFSANTSKTYLDIQNKLKPNEAAITIIKEDIKTNDSSSVMKYVALVLRKDKPFPVLVRISKSKEFETNYINDYINMIYDRNEDAVSYNRFWKSIAAQLTGINTVYISTDGIYNQINLYTLKDPVTHKYLLDQFNISILPNLNYMFNELKSNSLLTAELYGFPDYDYDFEKKASEAKSLTALALNRYGAAKLIPLPGTKTEVDNIAGYLGEVKWKVNVYEKEKASEEQLKKVVSPKVLHIATHGFFLKDIMDKNDKSIMGFESTKLKMNPLLRSGIMLAGASAVASDTIYTAVEQDGIFTAYEASLLNLSNTDLVVLSACETGLGVDLNNQGVYGLQRAFYIAGAKNLIMSLWQVDDDATMILMSEFYKEWSLDPSQQSITKAFKKAQREVQKKYPHPYYWGAFTLLGN
ncbi:MAG: CHAT domain-containing protein [Burkholderiales bacterium]|nr:CHAT domain-containing protein [Bacteroidia bacterium]